MPAPTATDVGPKFDALINGQGYLEADLQDVKAEFGYTPTFVTRQNTQGDYGDNQQDFWLTYTQRDWSLGEQQKFQGRDEEGKRRYWQGTKIDVTEPGQATIRAKNTYLTVPSSHRIAAAASEPLGGEIYFVQESGQNLYKINSAGTFTSLGAHGLAADPECMIGIGGSNGFLFSSTLTGSVGVRRYTAGFTTWSATKVRSLAYLNNTAYGVNTTDLYRFDTAGTATSVFQWKDAAGTASGDNMTILPFGGKLLILRPLGWTGQGAELWLYDGTAPALIQQFPGGFVGQEMAVLNGIVFVSGTQQKNLGGVSVYRHLIWFYSNGNTGVLWKSDTFTAGTPGHGPALGTFNSSLVFDDVTTDKMMLYNPATGGISSIMSSLNVGSALSRRIVSAPKFFIHFWADEFSLSLFPDDGYESTATVTSSLSDFDSSLTKLFRGIKVDFDLGTDGNGGSVDIAYRLNDVDGSYTTLQTTAASGTEYTLSGVTGRSLSVKITLNKGTSTSGPVLKRIALRAAPQQPGFKKFTLVLQLSGVKAPLEGGMMQLRDGTSHTKSGAEMAANLVTAAASTTPISVTTELYGTLASCLVDQEGFKIQRVRRNEYLAYVPIREV